MSGQTGIHRRNAMWTRGDVNQEVLPWMEHQGKVLLKAAFERQVLSLQKLVQVLEQIPRDGPFSAMRKDLTRSVNDLIMRGVWCIEPQHQEALLAGLWCQETSGTTENWPILRRLWRLHQLLDMCLEHSGQWYTLRAQLLGAAIKALMVWGNVKISETMTPAWTGQELLEVTKDHLPEIHWLLQDYCWHEAQCLHGLLDALQLLMDAKWHAPHGPAADRLNIYIHETCDWLARLLMLRYGPYGEHGRELLCCTHRQVRGRILNRSYYVVQEKMGIFEEAAQREIEKKNQRKMLKDLNLPAAAARADSGEVDEVGAEKPRFQEESGSGDQTKDNMPEPYWHHETNKARWADLTDTS